MDAELVKHAPPSIEDAFRVAEMLPGSVRLFGSVARGEATALSDIDLLVVLDDVDYGQASSIAGELRWEARNRTGWPLDVWVLDWPRWESNIIHPFTLEGRALTDGRWLKYAPPGNDVKWEKKVSPDKVRIDLLKNAISTLNTHLNGIVTNFQISSDEKLAIEYKNASGYWGALVGRLGMILHFCHIVLEQAFAVIDHLAVATHPKDEKAHHGLRGTYEAFGKELKGDFHNMLASAGVGHRRNTRRCPRMAEMGGEMEIAGYLPPGGRTERR